MKRYACLVIALSFINGIFAANGVCHRCEQIREENKKKVNQYEYYEDYLKDQKDQTKPEKQQTQKETNKEPQNR